MTSAESVQRPTMTCLPSGFSLGQKRCAKVSLTMTTLGDLASSAAVKSRPPRSGTRMVWNHCGLTASMSINGRCGKGTLGWPSGKTGVIRFHVSGSAADIAASRTPGSARTRRKSSSKKAICCSGFAYFTVGSVTFIASTLRLSKPGSTRRSWPKLRSRSPAPMSRSNDNATWPTTSKLFMRARPCPTELPRPSSRNAPCRSTRESCSAGSIPKMMPVSSETPRVNSRTRKSMPTGTPAGSWPAPHLAKARIASQLMPIPRMPATKANSILSVRSCCTTVPRVAPRAERRAISLRRYSARESRRLATLAQAISSTTATAAVSIRTLPRTSDTTMSRRGVALITIAGSASGALGFCSRYCRLRTASSASAFLCVVPGRRRASSPRYPTPIRNRCVDMSEYSKYRGDQMSASPTNGNCTFVGSTPTTVWGVVSSMIVCPTMWGSLLKRVFQIESLSMTTGLPSGRPSSSVNVRPSCGSRPRSEKKFAETRAIGTCKGSPRPVRFRLSVVNAATPSSDWLWSRRSS